MRGLYPRPLPYSGKEMNTGLTTQAKRWALVAACTSWCAFARPFQQMIEFVAIVLAALVVGALLFASLRFVAADPRRAVSQDDDNATIITVLVLFGCLFLALVWWFAGLMCLVGVLGCAAFTVAVGKLINLGSLSALNWVWPRLSREPHPLIGVVSIIAAAATVVLTLIAFDWSAFDAYRTAVQHPVRQFDSSVIDPIAQASQKLAASSVRTLWTELLPLSALFGFLLAVVEAVSDP